MPTPPSLSPEQRAAASLRAAQARTVRAQVRADLKSGRANLADILQRADTDEHLASMRVSALVESLPGYGKARAAGLLTDLQVAPTRRVRGLGPNQRTALLTRTGQTAESPS